MNDSTIPHQQLEDTSVSCATCAALDRDSMRCTIYENRPLICREFELGSEDCHEERKGSATAYG